MLGRYLLRDLLVAGVPTAVLVRGKRQTSADERVETIVGAWEGHLGRALPRPVVVAGSLSEAGLGLSEQDRRWLGRYCFRLIHSAASLKFETDKYNEPWATNLEGTRLLLDFCGHSGILDFHHVSTAYVAGLREDRVGEDELDVGQAFANPYEESKAQAELLLRDSAFLRRITVYRPSIIVGDSETGYSSTFHGVYLPLRVGEMLAPRLPANFQQRFNFLGLFGMEEHWSKNLVPVQWVSAAILRILSLPQAERVATHHLTSPEPVSAGELQEAYWESLAPLIGTDPLPATAESIEGLIATLLEQMNVYKAYWRDDPRFESASLHGLPCPVLDRQCLHKLFRYALTHNFSEPSCPAPRAEVPEARSWLAERCQEGEGDLMVGLRLTGPGGTDWHCHFRQGRPCHGEPGLPPDAPLTLYLRWATLREVSEGQLTAHEALSSGRVLAMAGPEFDTPRLVSLLNGLAGRC